MTLIESGLTADEVAKTLVDDNVRRELAKTEGSKTFAEETEIFADEIKVIAQALAYRNAVAEDIPEVMKLLNSAYSPEIEDSHAEAFRRGEAVTLESINDLFADPSYTWILVEAPSGRNVELDGVVLGACCYSTDGISRKNGQVEGNLGSIRLFGVLPRFHGVCVGLRLLHRVESQMIAAGCVRSMACVASPRKSMCAWLQRRGYSAAGSTDYPSQIGHSLRESSNPADFPVQLCIFVKPIEGIKDTADGKSAKRATKIGLRQAAENNEDSSTRPQLPIVSGKMHLPPHWRYSQEEVNMAYAGVKADTDDAGDCKGGLSVRVDDELGVD